MLIKEYFRGQEIFITGGSGFVGKALIEKLVRSCPDISKIYVLLRPKKGKNVNDRLQEILETKFFKRAKNENSKFFDIIEAIEGDCAEKGLGLKKDDLKKLENVTIIYHSAASVRFDDPLREAVLLNTRGTYELLKIAETLRKLQVFVHVSTAYCNAERMIIEEKVYKPTADWRQTVKIAENYSEDILDTLSLKYSDFKPNTYTFTKALSEQVVDDFKHKVPVLIYRPAIVTSCLDDPYPGWIDNFNGPMGMLIGCGIGILRLHNSDAQCTSAVVPVDIVIRGMIIATYKKGLQAEKESSKKSVDAMDVYNCTIDSISRISTEGLVEMGRECIFDNPFEKTLWVPGGSFHNCPFLFAIKFFFLQILMSIGFDILLRLSGRKPMILKLQRRIRYALKAVHTFIINEWTFKVENFFGLDKLVSSTEYDDFAFLEKSKLNFRTYVIDGIKGSKEYLLKENPVSSPGARMRLKILECIYYPIRAISYIAMGYFLFKFCIMLLNKIIA